MAYQDIALEMAAYFTPLQCIATSQQHTHWLQCTKCIKIIMTIYSLKSFFDQTLHAAQHLQISNLIYDNDLLDGFHRSLYIGVILKQQLNFSQSIQSSL